VILLVNSQPAVDAQGNLNPGQAVYATLRPMPLTAGVNDAFVIVNVQYPTASTGGFFTQKNQFLMGNFDGTGSEDVLTYSFAPSLLNIAVYDPQTGNLRGVMTSQDNDTPIGAGVVNAAAALNRVRTKPLEPDWFAQLDPTAQQALALVQPDCNWTV
jgi:hypothetical protein